MKGSNLTKALCNAQKELHLFQMNLKPKHCENAKLHLPYRHHLLSRISGSVGIYSVSIFSPILSKIMVFITYQKQGKKPNSSI